MKEISIHYKIIILIYFKINKNRTQKTQKTLTRHINIQQNCLKKNIKIFFKIGLSEKEYQ